MSAEAIDSKISNLKRGKAEVIESNHVLILGWSSKIVKLLQELCLAERYQVTTLFSWEYEHQQRDTVRWLKDQYIQGWPL